MDQIEMTLGTFKWVDVTNPTKELLEQIANDFSLSKKIVFNCLDPDYLPHVESYGATQFVLLRFMEPDSGVRADNVQELTTKVALFFNQNKLVSIHRLPLKEVLEIEKKINHEKKDHYTKSQVVNLFLEQAALGFEAPLLDLEHKLESFEEKIFQFQKMKSLLLEGYYIKRKSSAYRKVIKLTMDVVNKLMQKSDCVLAEMQESKDRLERNLFYADEVHESIQMLLNLHMSIEAQKTNEASFRTNEIMRVLTVLSIFFLPLNFIAGVFGMNFEQIPLLKHPLGFWISLAVMFTLSVLLSLYVLKKGWLLDRPMITTNKLNKNESK